MTQEKMQEVLAFWEGKSGQDLLCQVQELLSSGVNTDSLGSKASKRNLAVLKIKDRLSAKYTSEILDIAVQIALGRQNSSKLVDWQSAGLFLTTQLEQATHPLIAQWHAQRFNGIRQVYDFCSGLGFDSFYLAKSAAKVIAIEKDPVAAAFCLHNARLQGLDNITVICADVEHYVAEQTKFQPQAVWADPDRRANGGQRTRSPELAQPSLDFFASITCSDLIGVKLSPLAKVSQTIWQREYIGFAKECKEQVLWSTQPGTMVVSLVDQQLTWSVANERAVITDCEAPGDNDYILEPHAAIVASGETGQFFAVNGVNYLADARLGISTCMPSPSAWQQSFRVLKTCSFRPKDVNRQLKDLDWGNGVSIKKAGVAQSAEALRSQLKFPTSAGTNDHNRVIYVIKMGKRITANFCERV